MKKTKVKMNESLYLGMSILDISKTLMDKFWYEYTKPKYGDKAKLCYTDTDSIITHIMSEVYGFFKDQLGGKIMKEFVALRAKTYAYLTDDGEKKKAKGTNKCVIKRELMFENYKDCLFNDEVILKSQQRFKSDHHKVYTEEANS